MGAIAGRVAANASARPVGHLLRPIETTALGRPSTWTSEGVLLVHLVPAASEAAMYSLSSRTPPFHVAADARLDDRAALAARLETTAAHTSDAELIRLAYAKWGPDCVTYLTGDFAFAIWEPETRRLFCARDHMGIRPLYYRHDEEGLSFATSLASLSRPGDAINPERLAAFIEGFDDSFDDTVFSAIRRLPPAHWMLWTAGGLKIHRYWTLEAEAVPANEDFALGFRERFLQAVDDRLHGAPAIGALLSGGLDSSSIVSAAAARHSGDPAFKLRTFSFSYRDASRFDERAYGEAVLEAYGLDCEYVDMDDIAPLDGLADLIEAGDDLFLAPGLPKVMRVLARARKSGVNVVLDGHGGDEVASHGYGRLAELARAGRWLALYRELRGVSSIYGQSPVSLLGKYYFSQGIGLKLRRRLWRKRRPLPGPAGGGPGRLIAPDLAAAGNIVERSDIWTAAYRRAGEDENALHGWNVSSPVVARSFETLARATDRLGVELRFPFYDRRLVSYALAVPEGEKLQNGWTRSVLRRGMKGILPEKVRWRRSKIDFGAELSEGMARHHKGLFGSILRDDGPLAAYVDLAKARVMTAHLFANPTEVAAADLFTLWRIAFLGMWLESRKVSLAREEVLT